MIQKEVFDRFGSKRLCSELSRDVAAQLLAILQEGNSPIGAYWPKAMGPKTWVGYQHGLGVGYTDGYAVVRSLFGSGARVPLATIHS
jgi:hypothetical protein